MLIRNIRRGAGKQSEYVYARLDDDDGGLVIAAGLDYILQAITDRQYKVTNLGEAMREFLRSDGQGIQFVAPPVHLNTWEGYESWAENPWVEASHRTRIGDFLIREAPNGRYDIKEPAHERRVWVESRQSFVSEQVPEKISFEVDGAYVQAEFLRKSDRVPFFYIARKLK